MRRSLISQAVEEKDEPNITPMLDVAFNIFYCNCKFY
jgi:biopolymer transport protein ExbD